jgi:hemerythrin
MSTAGSADMNCMFEWKDSFSVRIDSVDAQHRVLFGIAKELHAAMAAGQGRAVIGNILERLIQYTVMHFSHEERLLKLHSYPGFEQHHGEHEALKQRIVEFQAEFAAGRATVTVQLLAYLKKWLESHILGSDQRYAPYLKSRAVA